MFGSIRKTTLAALLCTAAFAIPAGAQATPDQGGNPPANPGGQGGQGGPNGRADFRQRMMDGIKTQLGVSDDEWKALEPRVQAVMDAQRATRGGGGRFFGGQGGRRGNRGGDQGGGNTATAPQPSDRPTSAVEAASTALRETLDNKSSSPEEIKAKLAALRDARTKAKADLTKSQDSLRELLTARQEAVMVQFGLLE